VQIVHNKSNEEKKRCQCGKLTGITCRHMLDAQPYVIEYVPFAKRTGNPAIDLGLHAKVYRVARVCAEELIEASPRYTRVVEPAAHTTFPAPPPAMAEHETE